MATITSKVSTHISQQSADFIRADHPGFLSFLKAYYEFLESAELKLKNFGSIDSILFEQGSSTYIVLEDTNRYRINESNNILLEDYNVVGGSKVRSNGAFINGETITGQTTNATAIIRTEDINNGSRLFISAQNKFKLGEQIVGQTSGATAYIVSYTANPVQNVMQLLQYMDVDDTIEAFFLQFKESFMKSIPDKLADGLDKRNLLKNIKDLYRAKGSKKGHELFFRILLDENAELYYPTKDLLRVSDGKWSDDTILRLYAKNDTVLMENASDQNDIFVVLEDGSQLVLEDSIDIDNNLTRLIGQTITQKGVTDLTILSGGPYFNQGYEVINETTAIVDSTLQYTFNGERITELVLNPGSIDGKFFAGHTITGIDNTDSNLTITGKIASVISNIDINSSEYQTSQYFSLSDPISISSDTGNDGIAVISSVTSGTIKNIIVDQPGTGYEVGDQVIVDNTNTNGVGLSGEVSIVNGGFIPEDGTITEEFRITLEDGTPGYPGEMLLEESQFTFETPSGTLEIGETITGITSNATGIVISILIDVNKVLYSAVSGSFSLGEIVVGSNSGNKVVLLTNETENFIANEDDREMFASDRFILEGETIRGDTYNGSVIVQEEGTGVGDITDIRVTQIGYGYTYLPNVTISSVSGIDGTIKAKGTNVGNIKSINIINQGVHYTDEESLKFLTTSNFLCTNITNNFTFNEPVTGQTSGATARFKSHDIPKGVFKLDQLSAVPFIPGEVLSGDLSGETATIDSYTKSNIPGKIDAAVDRTGKYIGQDGFISEASKRIQDSFYWQDYSYVVKTASSIVSWRDDLLSAVHPSGWAVFGQVDITAKLNALANITSVSGLGAVYNLIWPALFGMRLGTIEQSPLNPDVMNEANEPTDKQRLYDPALAVTPGDSFTLYETITGSISGATALVQEDSTTDEGKRVVTYYPISGILQPNDLITGSISGETATILEVFGLTGKRDRTLYRTFDLDFQVNTSGLDGLGGPTYDNFTEYGLFETSLTITRSLYSTDTFRGHPVFKVGVPISKLNGNITDVQTSITLTDGSLYPTTGTVQIEDELIDYTLRVGNDLTGCTRGQYSTTAVAHNIDEPVDAIRWATKMETTSGYRIMDWEKNHEGFDLPIGDFTDNPKHKNHITPPTEVTLYKT